MLTLYDQFLATGLDGVWKDMDLLLILFSLWVVSATSVAALEFGNDTQILSRRRRYLTFPEGSVFTVSILHGFFIHDLHRGLFQLNIFVPCIALVYFS